MPNSISENGKRKGFSILEVVISVAVLAVGLVAAVGLIAGSIKDSIDSRDNIIAANLAQEGVELIRNVRDNDWTGTGAFGDSFPAGNPEDCRIDKSLGGIPCDSGANHKKLYYKDNFYVHDGTGLAVETKFQRTIMLDDAVAGNLNVVSVVTWHNDFSNPSPAKVNLAAECNAGKKCIYIEDVLTDWKI